MKTINSFISEKLKVTKQILNKHKEYVDLGLPSGTLWAKCNIGAHEETEYGDYFAWGEIEPKKTYNWSTYKYCKGHFDDLTKYCNKSVFGHDDFTDNILQLEPSDDAAHVNMGDKWCIPTDEQFQELINNTTNEWIENYNGTGINGRLFTSKDNTLFLPATGFMYEYKHLSSNQSGTYWSSIVDYQQHSGDAFCVYFWKDKLYLESKERNNGRVIRPVLNK